MYQNGHPPPPGTPPPFQCLRPKIEFIHFHCFLCKNSPNPRIMYLAKH